MNDIFMAIVVFASIFAIIKMFTDYLLKRRIVKSGHIDKAGILQPIKEQEDEPQTLKSLKWAFVASMAGLGMIVSYIIGKTYGLDKFELNESMITFGIELLFIGLGFLFYFLVAIRYKK